MKKHVSLELRVSVDVGCRSHNVAIGLSSGEILDEFLIAHEPEAHGMGSDLSIAIC